MEEVAALGLVDAAAVSALPVEAAKIVEFLQWRWDKAHRDVDITGEGGALATRKGGGGGYRSAVCGEVLQAEGEAYAEFTCVSGGYNVMVGVARAGVDPSSVERGLHETADGWMYYSGGGAHYHNYTAAAAPRRGPAVRSRASRMATRWACCCGGAASASTSGAGRWA